MHYIACVIMTKRITYWRTKVYKTSRQALFLPSLNMKVEFVNCVLILIVYQIFLFWYILEIIFVNRNQRVLLFSSLIIVSLSYYCQPQLLLSASVIIASLSYYCQPQLLLSASVIIVSFSYYCQPQLLLYYYFNNYWNYAFSIL